MRNQLVERWESKLKSAFDRIDDILEEKYGDKFLLHPARLPRGSASNKEDDGLFELAVGFSAGIGSPTGPGYIFKVRIATLANVPQEFREQVEKEVVALLEKELPKEFPGKDLKITYEDGKYKIYGDLKLD